MAFDYQPVLTGERVELRPLRTDDFDALFAVASDPLIWEQHPASDRYGEEPFRAFFSHAIDSGAALRVRRSAREPSRWTTDTHEDGAGCSP
jgi:RimJ/RimL family protein N-acetyltransferase